MAGTGGTDQIVSLMTVTGPAEAGSMTPIAFYGSEAISTCFQFTIEVLTDVPNLSMDAMLHKPVCLTVKRAAGQSRIMHGLLRRMTVGDTHVSGKYRYILEIVPQLQFLEQTQDCRVYQNKTAKEIMSSLFADAGITAVSFVLHDSPPKRDYTVQMNETDLAFVTRLMQEEGWYYFFRFETNKHTLIITNANTTFSQIVAPELELNRAMAGFGYLSSWEPAFSTAVGQTILKDYDPSTPDAKLEATKNTVLQVSGAAKRDKFTWPARSFDHGQVDRRTKFQIEAAEARSTLIDGTGQHFGMMPGGKFQLKNDPQGGSGKGYVVFGVIHQATQPAGRSGGEQAAYLNSFVAFPASQTWRDEMALERPYMSGLYSATVIGPEGDEIYTDELGRVKVRFPWDRRKDSTADGSVWVRVVQPWAGPGWGAQFLPRVNTEVAVAFMDGDIDRPVVVGGLYNGNAKPVFTLPDQKTKSGLRTRSTLKGTATNFSEFSFDDAKGQEVVFLQAERDHTVNVKRNENVTVGSAQMVVIGGSQTTFVSGPLKPPGFIDNELYTLNVKNGNAFTNVELGGYDVLVNKFINIGSKLKDVCLTADVGNIILTAQTSIKLVVGQNTLTIDEHCITVNGMQLKFSGTSTAELGAPMTKLSGDGTLTLKGGMVKIN